MSEKKKSIDEWIADGTLYPVGSLWVSPSLRAIDAKRSSLDRLVGAELFCVIILNESVDYVDVVCLDGDKMTLTHGELEFYYERA